MKKVIKIFLGSSITEFKNERADIENFIRRVSDQFEEKYDVKIKPLLCEDFDEALSKIRKQEEYNEKVRKSDMCFFIFFTKAGQYTREEFNAAREQFEKTDKPKISTYFKVLGDEKADDSLYDFMDELDKTLGHYYGTFEHIDTVKLRILLNLKLQEMDFLEIKADGDVCTVDGEAALSLSNVSEFANNKLLTELKGELEKIESRYFTLKAKYAEGECSEKEEKEYINAASKRASILETIDELEKNIFNMSLRMCHDEAKGDITSRQREAYRLFEAGDLDGANAILDFSEIKNEYLRRKAIREAEQKNDARIFIRESRTKIDVLSAMVKRPERFDEIEEIYDEITKIAAEEQVELDTVYDFVCFLYGQNKLQKAYDIAKSLEELLSDDEKIMRLYNVISLICDALGAKTDEAGIYYKKSIKICEKLAKQDPERFDPYLSSSYGNFGLFCYDCGEYGEAEKYYEDAIKICEHLAKRFNIGSYYSLASCYNNLGMLYDVSGSKELAEKYYKKGIRSFEYLANVFPEKYDSELSKSYNNVGVFYSSIGNYKDAKKYFKKSIQIRERLEKQNPEKFASDLATSYNNAGNAYNAQENSETAEEYFIKAIKIYEKMTGEKAEIFEPELAACYNNVGIAYSKQKRYDLAEKYFRKAIEIREKLAEKDKEKFEPDLATSYNNIGNLYKETDRRDSAELYYKKAIEIRESLVCKNPEKYKYDLAQSYLNYAILKEDFSYIEKITDFLGINPS